MRVTHRMISDTTIHDLRNNLARLEASQNQITTGTRLSRPSDDPAAVARALTYKADLAAGESYLRTIDSSQAWLTATDEALGQAGDLLQRARELAVQGANGTLDASQMAAIGAEVDQLLNQLVVTANSSLRGQRLFAGTRIDSDPFALTGGPPGYVYTGDGGKMEREYVGGTNLLINTPGPDTFNPALGALISLRNDLNAGNATAVGANDIGAIDIALDAILTARAKVGAKANRLEMARGHQELLQVNIEELRSKTEDTDLAEAIGKFSIQETVYKASLEMGAKAIQPSLLDYLR